MLSPTPCNRRRLTVPNKEPVTPEQTDDEHAGDPGHPQHSAYLLELGRATFAAAGVATIAFDILRVLGGVSSAEMYNDPLGQLEQRLSELLSERPELPQLEEFVTSIGNARKTRNDLIHALQVRDGLHRRNAADPHCVRNYFDVEDLRAVVVEFEAVRRLGAAVLYSDDGAAVRAWYSAGGS